MLTLAFAQIAWSIAYQWDSFTGGSNGLVGVWPAAGWPRRPAFYLLTLALCSGGVWLLRRALFSPSAYALRAGRDSPLRAGAVGIDVQRIQWAAFAASGASAGPRRRPVRVLEGSISPDSTLAVSRSIDALVMVLLGACRPHGAARRRRGVYLAAGRDRANTDYWRHCWARLSLQSSSPFARHRGRLAARRFGAKEEAA